MENFIFCAVSLTNFVSIFDYPCLFQTRKTFKRHQVSILLCISWQDLTIKASFILSKKKKKSQLSLTKFISCRIDAKTWCENSLWSFKSLTKVRKSRLAELLCLLHMHKNLCLLVLVCMLMQRLLLKMTVIAAYWFFFWALIFYILKKR